MLLSNLYTTKNKKLRITDMSHDPESHGSHHEPAPEPERVPIEDPRDEDGNYRVTRNVGDVCISTHQGPNGDFYTIENSDISEAVWRFDVEDNRNAKIARQQDALANGLYRKKDDTLLRPAPTTDKFVKSLNAAGVSTEVLGIPGNEGNMSLPLASAALKSFAYEKNAIDSHSAAIVVSNEARDKALSEGKPWREAQQIGAEKYIMHDALNKHEQLSPFTPKPTSLNLKLKT